MISVIHSGYRQCSSPDDLAVVTPLESTSLYLCSQVPPQPPAHHLKRLLLKSGCGRLGSVIALSLTLVAVMGMVMFPSHQRCTWVPLPRTRLHSGFRQPSGVLEQPSGCRGCPARRGCFLARRHLPYSIILVLEASPTNPSRDHDERKSWFPLTHCMTEGKPLS